MDLGDGFKPRHQRSGPFLNLNLAEQDSDCFPGIAEFADHFQVAFCRPAVLLLARAGMNDDASLRRSIESHAPIGDRPQHLLHPTGQGRPIVQLIHEQIRHMSVTFCSCVQRNDIGMWSDPMHSLASVSWLPAVKLTTVWAPSSMRAARSWSLGESEKSTCQPPVSTSADSTRSTRSARAPFSECVTQMIRLCGKTATEPSPAAR